MIKNKKFIIGIFLFLTLAPSVFAQGFVLPNADLQCAPGDYLNGICITQAMKDSACPLDGQGNDRIEVWEVCDPGVPRYEFCSTDTVAIGYRAITCNATCSQEIPAEACTAIDVPQNFTELDPTIGTLGTAGQVCTTDGNGIVNCDSDFPILTEADPKIGTLGADGQFCTAVAGKVTCITDAPAADLTVAIGILPISKGGTGAIDAAGARTNLGLGSLATQATDAVAITGGSITGITDLSVADGGTGASTAAGARTNLGAVNIAGDTMTGTLNLPSNGLVVGVDQLVVSGGNVGIGITAPAEALEVSSLLGTASRLRVTDTVSGRNPEMQLQFGLNINDHWGLYVDKAANNSLKLWGGSDRLTVSLNGNVSIGTNVNGTDTSMLAVQGNGSALTPGYVTFGPGSKAVVGTPDSKFLSNFSAGSTVFLKGTAYTVASVSSDTQLNLTTYPITNVYGPTSPAAIANPAITEYVSAYRDPVLLNVMSGKGASQMSVTPTGNLLATNSVGIGNTAPQTKLHVTAYDTGSNTLLSALRLEHTSMFPQPVAGFGVSQDFYLQDFSGALNQAAQIGVAWEDSTDGSEDSSIRFSQMKAGALVEAMRIDDVGKVGIGITTPSRTLDVNGTIRSSGSDAPWSPNGWDRAIEMTQGDALVWLKGASGPSRGLGVSSNGIMYFARNTADDNTGTNTYDMTLDASGNLNFTGTGTITGLCVVPDTASASCNNHDITSTSGSSWTGTTCDAGTVATGLRRGLGTTSTSGGGTSINYGIRCCPMKITNC